VLWDLARTAVVLHLNLVRTAVPLAAPPRQLTFFSPPKPRRVPLEKVEELFLAGTLNRNSLVKVDGSDDYMSFSDFVEQFGLEDQLSELEDTCRKHMSPSPKARREMILADLESGEAILTPTTRGEIKSRAATTRLAYHQSLDEMIEEAEDESDHADEEESIAMQGDSAALDAAATIGVSESDSQRETRDQSQAQQQPQQGHLERIIELEGELGKARDEIQRKDSQIAELTAELTHYEGAFAVAQNVLQTRRADPSSTSMLSS
jgi:hypothetical protein